MIIFIVFSFIVLTVVLTLMMSYELRTKTIETLKGLIPQSKKKWVLDNAAIIEIDRKIDAAKKTKNKVKIRISKLEKRKTNISKKTNNEIEKLEKAKNDYIHTKMKEFQL